MPAALPPVVYLGDSSASGAHCDEHSPTPARRHGRARAGLARRPDSRAGHGSAGFRPLRVPGSPRSGVADAQPRGVAGAARVRARRRSAFRSRRRVREWLAADEVVFTLLRRPTPRPGEARFVVEAQIFVSKEPRARVAFWSLRLERRAGGFVVVTREEVGQMEGLVHLKLGPQAYRAKGVVLRQKDLELRLEDGTLFSSPDDVGPTLLVFVGRARVRFTPEPEAEREQLRQFSGEPALWREVPWAFVRMHPVDFRRALAEQALEPDAEPRPAPRGGGADLPRALRAQLHRRRAAAALAVVADARRRRRRRRLPLEQEARADVRAHVERGRGREPVRPRPPPPDLQLLLERSRDALQRGRRPPARRAGARHHRPAGAGELRARA